MANYGLIRNNKVNYFITFWVVVYDNYLILFLIGRIFSNLGVLHMQVFFQLRRNDTHNLSQHTTNQPFDDFFSGYCLYKYNMKMYGIRMDRRSRRTDCH